MNKKLLLALALFFIATIVSAGGKTHKVAFHLDEKNNKVMNLALNNLANLAKAYSDAGDELEVELVAYGPGLEIFIADQSPVQSRIESMLMSIDNLTFSACGNTIAGRKRKTGKDVKLIEGVEITPSGVVRLVELQEQGYAYIRP